MFLEDLSVCLWTVLVKFICKKSNFITVFVLHILKTVAQMIVVCVK